ncbi:MAG TPA: cytochrome c biogenesis protein CcdA [Casimicrobiaceae bacterium]|jgi:cytochrome c-type biogenesis protein|nr:cytochrome c biogenesis protein CcdA [Casimicrobiaceae bacterium]
MNDGSGVGNMAALVAGMVSFLSPCVLPLVPAYLSYIAGEAIDEARDPPRHARLFTLALSTCFVLGFSLVFIALGASATAIGSVLLQYKEQANIVAGVIVIFFGALMLGGARWFAFLQRDFRFHVDRVAGNPFSAFLLGMAFAFGWTPCIGPVLGGVLTISATQNDVGTGIRLLAAYSLGLGLPFILTALFLRRAVAHLKRLRTVGLYLQWGAGSVMIAVGIAMITGQLTALSYWLLRVFPALGNIG